MPSSGAFVVAMFPQLPLLVARTAGVGAARVPLLVGRGGSPSGAGAELVTNFDNQWRNT